MVELLSFIRKLYSRKWIILLGFVLIFLLSPNINSIASVGYVNVGTIYLNKSLTDLNISTDLAELSFIKSIQFNNKNVNALRNLGILYVTDGKWAEAEVLLESGLDMRPEDILINFYLASVYGELGNREGRLDALRLSRAWQLLRENHAEDGLSYYTEGEYNEAEMEFRGLLEAALELKDDYWIGQGYQWLGWSLENQDELEGAIIAYLSAIDIGSGQIPEAMAMMDLAYLYNQMEKFSQSSDLINRAIELHPHNRYLLLVAGDIYKSRGECVIAIEYYQLATYENPLDGLPWEKIAECYSELGKFHEVIQAAKTSIPISRMRNCRSYLRAKAYMKLGDRIQACKDLQKAFSISPEEMGLRQDLIDANCIMERE